MAKDHTGKACEEAEDAKLQKEHAVEEAMSTSTSGVSGLNFLTVAVSQRMLSYGHVRDVKCRSSKRTG